MANILDNIQNCQYDDTIVDSDGNIRTVKSVESPRADVDVTPVQEGTSNRKVYTAVELIEASGTQRTASIAEVAPLVRVALEGAGTNIYGALETINTKTQRCGVLTSGVVVFRKTAATGAADGVTGDIGKSVEKAPANTNSGEMGFNNGTVAVSATTGVGKGIILSYVGPYLLVDLSR